ncbi:MAG: hypothetical protein WCJ60_04345 [bacterium]
MTIKVPITYQMQKEAQTHIDKMNQNLNTFGDYGIREPNAFYTGIIGELAFKKALELYDKSYTHSSAHNGTDKADFYCTLYNLRDISIDVKTCSQPYYQYMVLPPKQYKQFNYDVYIGVRLNGNVAEIMGYCSHNTLEKINNNFKIECMGKQLDDLEPIENLMRLLNERV